jgi:hypothetical protein
MTPPMMICQRTSRGRRRGTTRCRATTGPRSRSTRCRALHRDDHIVARGYAVGFGQWFFFPPSSPRWRSAEPRMSADCSAYGVYEAARELRFCERHQGDELVLLIKNGDTLDRKAGEVDLLKRFMQALRSTSGPQGGASPPATSPNSTTGGCWSRPAAGRCRCSVPGMQPATNPAGSVRPCGRTCAPWPRCGPTLSICVATWTR